MRGFADQRPRAKNSPDDPANRRISLIVQYLPKEVPAGGQSGDKSNEKAEAVKAPNEDPPAAEHAGAKE